MSNLNFKWGKYADLAGVSHAEGTIYITTDERSMYVDTVKVNDEGASVNERVRIQGSVLYYDSVETFTNTTKPPYAQDTLYFFRKINSGDNKAANAIMAYDGSKWVQINTTKENYESLINDLSNLTGTVTTLSNGLTALTDRVTAAEATIKTHEASIKTLQDLVGTGVEGEDTLAVRLSTIEASVGDHETRLDNAEDAITTLSTSKADKSELTNGLNSKVDKDTYAEDKKTFALKTEVNAALSEKVDTDTYNGKIQEIEGSITTLTNNKADKTEVSSALSGKLDKSTYVADKPTFALKTDLTGKVDTDTYDGKIQEIEGSITTLTKNKADKSELTTGLNGKVDKSTYTEDKKTFALKSDLTGKVDASTYNGKVQEIEGSITTLTTTKADKSELTNGLNEKVDKSTYAADKKTFALKSDLDGKVDTDTYDGKIQEIEGSITTLTKNKADKSELSGKVDTSTYTEDKKTFALKGDVESALLGKVDSNVYTGKIQEIEGSITTLGNTKADQSALETLETNLTTKINDDIRTANALVYKGTIEKKADLPSLPEDLENAETIPEIRIGDMYVISKIDVDNNIASGDLFIAQGTENEETGLIEADLTWSHVKTGYDAQLNPVLKLNNNKQIILETYAGTQVGAIQLASASDNLEITVANQTLTFNNVWGTF